MRLWLYQGQGRHHDGLKTAPGWSLCDAAGRADEDASLVDALLQSHDSRTSVPRQDFPDHLNGHQNLTAASGFFAPGGCLVWRSTCDARSWLAAESAIDFASR